MEKSGKSPKKGARVEEKKEEIKTFKGYPVSASSIRRLERDLKSL